MLRAAGSIQFVRRDADSDNTAADDGVHVERPSPLDDIGSIGPGIEPHFAPAFEKSRRAADSEPPAADRC